MTAITQVHAREVLDSRGRPTVEVELRTADDAVGRAMVPSGASTGATEAHELRDRDPSRYDGMGVTKAVAHVNQLIAPALVGQSVLDQAGLDQTLVALDGTPQKSRLGGNALVGVSLAAAHAAAASCQMPLYRYLEQLCATLWTDPSHQRPLAIPMVMTNMISGGLHAGGNLDFQDFLVVPRAAPDYRTALEWIVRVYHRLGQRLAAAGYEGRLVADEGGYGPRLTSNRQGIELVAEAVGAAGLELGRHVSLALDVAASHFFDGTRYQLRAEGGRRLTTGEMIEYLAALAEDFPLWGIEDGLAQEDWDGWQQLTMRLGERLQLVGDDLFTTNESRIRHGIEIKAANSVLIKVNQIGTLSESLQAMGMARQAGMTCIVSARSGETEDTTLADLAVGTRADAIKIGSVARSERLAKYNRLLRIEEELSQNCPRPFSGLVPPGGSAER